MYTAEQVFPAHAGMFPELWLPGDEQPGFPRARGDVPPLLTACYRPPWFSPRTRGCSGCCGDLHGTF